MEFGYLYWLLTYYRYDTLMIRLQLASDFQFITNDLL